MSSGWPTRLHRDLGFAAAVWNSSKVTPDARGGRRRHVGGDEAGRDRVRGDAERPSSIARVFVKPCRPALAAE